MTEGSVKLPFSIALGAIPQVFLENTQGESAPVFYGGRVNGTE